MAQEKRQIFRKESLEKLSSPERLDQLLRVVRPQGWMTPYRSWNSFISPQMKSNI